MKTLETTVTAKDLGRAYAICMPYLCEDRAWKRVSEGGVCKASDEQMFRAGFRSKE